MLCVLSVHFLHSFHIKTRSLLYLVSNLAVVVFFVVTCHLMCCMCNQFSSILTFLFFLLLLYMRFHEYNLMFFVDYHRSIESLIRSTPSTRFVPFTSRFTFFLLLLFDFLCSSQWGVDREKSFVTGMLNRARTKLGVNTSRIFYKLKSNALY